MECRKNCGACCIAISISSRIPGMPDGKPSGVRCIHLLDDYRCKLFDDPQRPKVCIDYQAEIDFCGINREEALAILYNMEGNFSQQQH
jgi:Fe-S-cluster containining protein